MSRRLPGIRRREPRVALAVASVIATALLVAVGRAQQVFRSGVDLVLVDLRVLHGDDQVSDLRADEVTLIVDGSIRPIASLDYYPAARRPHDAHTRGPAPGAAAASVRGSEPVHGRVVLVVDRTSMEPADTRPVLQAAQAFIARTPEHYAMAVATLPLAREIRFEPDREASARALAEALSAASRTGLGMEGIGGFGCTGAAASAGCGDQGLPLGSTDTQRARAMNSAAELQRQGRTLLRDLQRVFGAGEVGPLDVVLITGGLPRDEGLRPDITRFIAAARVNRVRIHALEVGNLSQWSPGPPHSIMPAGNPVPPSLSHTYDLPAETGGLEDAGFAAGDRFFTRLGRELAGSYVLAFQPLESERDGLAHRIEIRIARRPHLTVHARKVFVLEPSSVGGTNRSTLSDPSASGSPAPPPDSAAASTPSEVPPLAEVLESTRSGMGGAAPASATLARELADVLGRAAAYVDGFERTLAMLVAEERYVQVVRLWRGGPPLPGEDPELGWNVATGHALDAGVSRPVRRRQLLSDVLLVQTPGQVWMGYRDVAQVDGTNVRDRVERVQKLFLSGRAQDRRRLQRIADESARYNIGAERNINVPTFPLQILRVSAVGRFAWTLEGSAPEGADCCAVVGFREIATPYMVTTSRGRSIPLAGRMWIEPHTGRVWRTTLQFADKRERVQGALDVTYRASAGLDVLLPDRLWEWLRTPDPDARGRLAYVEGRASYTNIRRFTVNTEQTFK